MEEQWQSPNARLLNPRPLLLQLLPYIRHGHHGHRVPSLIWGSPPNVRGRNEVKHRPTAPLFRQEVSDLPPILLLPSLLRHLRPQNLLLGLPLRTHLEEVFQGLLLVLAPPVLRDVPILSPVEVLSSQAVLRFEVVEPCDKPLGAHS